MKRDPERRYAPAQTKTGKGVDMTERWTETGPNGPWGKAPPYPLLPTALWTTLRVAHMPTPPETISPAGRGPPLGLTGRNQSLLGELNFQLSAPQESVASLRPLLIVFE